MTQANVRFDRRFQVWLYSVSHGQLLLRSVKDAQHATQVDVLFKNVAAVNLPTLFQGLRVTEAAADQRSALHVNLGAFEASGRRFFKVEGEGWQGAVVAGGVISDESDAEYHAESKLIAR